MINPIIDPIYVGPAIPPIFLLEKRDHMYGATMKLLLKYSSSNTIHGADTQWEELEVGFQ